MIAKKVVIKEKKIAVVCLSLLGASIFAEDVTWNGKTISSDTSTSANVYIGPGTDADEAIVTVKSGAAWTSATNIFLGNAAGTSKLFIEEGGVLNATSKGVALSTISEIKADAEIENRGTVNLYSLHMGTKAKGVADSVFHNYGTLNVAYNFHLGKASGTTNVFHHHKGATLNATATGSWRFYVGGEGGYSTLILDDDINIKSKLWMGAGQWSKGNLVLNDEAVMNFDVGDELLMGYSSDTTARVAMNDDSRIIGRAKVHIGSGTRSTGYVVMSNSTVIAVTNESGFAVAVGTNAKGGLELNDNAKIMIGGGDFSVGSGSGAIGNVYVRDNAIITAPTNRLFIGKVNNSSGTFSLKDNACLVVSNICVAYPDSSNNNNIHGVLEIADSAVVSNVMQISLGRGASLLGLLKMQGGSLSLEYQPGKNPILLGSNGGFTDGIIRGYGFVGFNDAKKTMVDYVETFGSGTKWAGMTFCGQIVADGEGVELTLDFSRGPVPSYLEDKYNNCGTNGFYAVNKGKLKFQRSLPRRADNHRQIGIKPDHGSPLMVNGFQYTFDSATMNTLGTYVFSELYAVDRSDIPAGLPTGKGIHHAAVYRVGHFNETATPEVDDGDLRDSHKQNFSTLKLKFHYDPALAEIEDVRHVKVYRCTDSVKGGWTCVASITAPDPSSPYIETVEMAPSSELWNGGWFAVVGTPRVGTVMVLR